MLSGGAALRGARAPFIVRPARPPGHCAEGGQTAVAESRAGRGQERALSFLRGRASVRGGKRPTTGNSIGISVKAYDI